MHIFLVGFMGSGKSTIGRLLAEALEIPFNDMDQLIEENENMSIPEIFQKFGQDHFRILEKELVESFQSLPKDYSSINATGGGTPCFYGNMAKLNRIGTTVYLELSAEDLFLRLKKESHFRPILNGKNDSEMKETISDLLDYRKPYYELATYKVDGSKSIKAVVEQILYLINE